MNTIKKNILFLCALILLIGSSITIHQWVRDIQLYNRIHLTHAPNATQPLSALTFEQQSQDIDTLIQTLKSAYSGKNQLEFDEVIARLQRLSKTPMDGETFKKELRKALALLPDQHLALIDPRETQQTLYTRNKAILNDRPWWIEHQYTPDHKHIIILSISSFHASPAEEKKLLQTLKKLLPHVDGLIIDVSDNGGGDPMQALRFVEAIQGGYMGDYLKTEVQPLNPIAEALIDNRSWLLDEPHKPHSFWPYLPWISSPYFFTNTLTTIQNTPLYTVPILIFENENTASAAELFAESFAHNPYALLCGHASKGAFHYVDPGLLVLPNSHLNIFIPTSRLTFSTHASIEGKGLQPQKQLPHRQLIAVLLDWMHQSNA